MMITAQLSLAILLDLLLGDPRWFPHPVRGIGLLIATVERVSRRMISRVSLAGLLTTLVVLVVSVLTVFLLMSVVSRFAPPLEGWVAILVLYTAIAIKDLLSHANRVYEHLRSSGDLSPARSALAMIVGRDTKKLEEDDICRATVETVAENMVDGITAPLFFAVCASFLGSVAGISAIGWAAIGAYCYKTINTMDSMIGYKNEKYREFGKYAARLDDAANFIPARVSGVCLIIAAFFLQYDYRKAATVFVTDRLSHASPNAGHTEAAVAGALGLRLGGPASYDGVVHDKDYIGTAENTPAPEDIKRTLVLVLVGSTLFFMLLNMARIGYSQ